MLTVDSEHHASESNRQAPSRFTALTDSRPKSPSLGEKNRASGRAPVPILGGGGLTLDHVPFRVRTAPHPPSRADKAGPAPANAPWRSPRTCNAQPMDMSL